ncbi:hypothetical protein BC332_30806 [Capsicum chinense]|nr:hypothetical protein BC332_30806 [Capsicum chinense]
MAEVSKRRSLQSKLNARHRLMKSTTDGECLIEVIRSCRNKVLVYQSIRMPQLHTSLHFYLTSIGQRTHRYLSCATESFGEVRIEECSSWGGLTTLILLAVIHSALGCPAFTMGTITGTLDMRLSQSSRIRERSSQCSNAHTGYGPNYLMTF